MTTWSNDNAPEQRQRTDGTSGHRLPSRLRTGIEQDRTPGQFLRFIKLLNRKSTPDFQFRIEQSNSNSNSYYSSWFPLVVRYPFTSQDLYAPAMGNGTRDARHSEDEEQHDWSQLARAPNTKFCAVSRPKTLQ